MGTNEAKAVDVLAAEATTWAALTLTKRGAVLHSVVGGWDVELPDGSWRAANGWRELCAAARELRP